MSHKLRAVISHEFLTIIRQPSFWIAMFVVPLIGAFIIILGIVTDRSDKVDLATDKNKLTVALIDESNIVNKEAAATFGLQQEPAAKQAELESMVRSGKLDGLIVYPKNVATTGKYQLFADTTDDDKNSAVVTELGKAVLRQSILTPLNSPELAALAMSGGEGSMQSYTDGQPTRGINEYLVPGAFLAAFYIVLVFSVGYALTSVSEEKENRSIEMVLSYVKPSTLILGKLLSIILVTLTQILTFAIMSLAAYFIFRSFGKEISLPIDVTSLAFVPSEIIIGAGFLVFGFIFYVALMAMIGAIFPSSKEANSFSTVFFILPAVPFWGIEAITDPTPGLFAHVLTFFPLTSPTTALLRNAVGNIQFTDAIIALALLIAAAIATILLAARAFRMGMLEYTDRIKFSALFRK